ncbi:MAG: hypothetical protein AB8H86_03295 [Polyangiales bacterium]
MRITIIVCALMMSTLVEAQDADAPSEDERAQIHFRAANDSFSAGRYEEACVSFHRAYDLSQRSPLLYNLYLCEERIGNYAEAADYLEQFVEAQPDTGESYDERIRNLRARASQEAADAAAAAAVESPVVPEEEPVVDPPPSPEEQPEPGNRLMVPAMIGFGVGAAGLITFATFGGLALGQSGDFEAGCLGAGTCSDSDLDRQDTFTTVADIGWITGLVGVVAGTILLIVGAKSDADSSVAVVPFSDGRSTGLSASGTF